MKFIVCPDGPVIVADHILKYEIHKRKEDCELLAVYANPIANPPSRRKKKTAEGETEPTEVVLPEVHLPRTNPDFIEEVLFRGSEADCIVEREKIYTTLAVENVVHLRGY